MDDQQFSSASSVGKPGFSKDALVKLLFSFDGRVGRREFWVWFIAALSLNVLFSLLGETIGGLLSLLLVIPVVWASLAIYAKRFHDHDKSGWFTLLMFIPVVNLLVAIIWLGCIEGTKGPNRFGEPNSGGRSPI